MEKNQDYMLKNGSKIGVIGAGPAGTFFSYLLKKYAAEKNIDLDVTIFDRKKFYEKGVSGCNMCAGIVSSNLIKKMEENGIILPENVIQHYIKGYVLESKGGTLHIEKRNKEKIATVFRGKGPKGSSLENMLGFDEFLLNLVRGKIEFVDEYVTDIKLNSNNAELSTKDKKFYVDLVVVASGLNSSIPDNLEKLNFGYKKPESYSALQTEIPLNEKDIAFRFGDYVYTYNLGFKNIEFAAIIPKKEYLTVSLVGKNIKKEDLIEFLSNERIKKRFPPEWNFCDTELKEHCHCKPQVPINNAENPFTDRLVVIGDANCARLFKNGLESAFTTAEAAAKTVIEYGFSKDDLNIFNKKISNLIKDNYYGRKLFLLNSLISGNKFLASSANKIALMEQLKDKAPVNDILWDMLTGEDTYKNILKRMIKHNIPLRILFRI